MCYTTGHTYLHFIFSRTSVQNTAAQIENLVDHSLFKGLTLFKCGPLTLTLFKCGPLTLTLFKCGPLTLTLESWHILSNDRVATLQVSGIL